MSGAAEGSSVSTVDEIRVLASIALKGVYLELAPRFEQANRCSIATQWAGADPVLRRIQSGESADLVFAPARVIDELIASGKILRGGRVDIARCGVGMAVRRGAPRPDIGTTEAFKRALLGAESIAYSSGPSGVYLAGVFARMGIADALAAKVKQTPPGTFVGEAVARGEAEIGFQQMGELFHVGEGIDIVGPIPQEIQNVTVFSGGVHSGARQPRLARALLEFLSAPAAAPVVRKKGMEPA